MHQLERNDTCAGAGESKCAPSPSMRRFEAALNTENGQVNVSHLDACDCNSPYACSDSAVLIRTGQCPTKLCICDATLRCSRAAQRSEHQAHLGFCRHSAQALAQSPIPTVSGLKLQPAYLDLSWRGLGGSHSAAARHYIQAVNACSLPPAHTNAQLKACSRLLGAHVRQRPCRHRERAI